MPVQTFADVAAIGVVNVATDLTGTPRLFPMLFSSGDTIEASLPLRVASLATGESPGHRARADWYSEIERSGQISASSADLVLWFPRDDPHHQRDEVLAGLLDRQRVQNHVVVIGATVTGGGDVFPTPFDPVLPGVEVISTASRPSHGGRWDRAGQHVRLADGCIAVLLATTLVVPACMAK